MTITTGTYGFLLAIIGAFLLTVINPNIVKKNGERSIALDFLGAFLILFGIWIAAIKYD